MKKKLLLGLGVASVLSISWSDAPRAVRDRPIAFEELRLHFEVDLPAARSEDRSRPSPLRSLLEFPAEVVLEAKSRQGFAQIRMIDSAKRTVLNLDCSDTAKLGLSELLLESEGVTLGDALGEYPPGEYRVEALTVDRIPVTGTVMLSARFPGPFAVLSPRPAEVVPPGDVTIRWTPSREAVRYVLEIEQDELGFTFETRLPPWQTSFRVPFQVLEPGKPYEYSLAVQGDTDNELEVEGGFVTAKRDHARAR